MKLHVYILLLFSTSLLAQRAEDKIIFSKAKTLIVELESIDNLEIKNSDAVNTFRVVSNDVDNSNAPKVYVEDGIVHIKVMPDLNNIVGADKSKYRAGQPLFPKHTIYIPVNINTEVFYEKGNFITKDFDGNLDLHIRNYGYIEIHKFKGIVSIESFSGKIDCAVSEAILNIETSKGLIESSLKDVNLTATTTSLKGVYGNSNNILNIKTINAKVTLKPFKNQ